MNQKSRHIIRLVTILAALCLLFSISSFADDATPSNFLLMAASSSGPTWSNWNPGNNVWYDENGIPYYQTFGDNETYYGNNNLLGSPIFAPQAGAGRSTFYGTSNLNTSSNLLGGTREYLNDTFDSNFTADADGLTTSYASIHDSTFTASKTASVTANNGTVMEMYDNNFNGNTTVTAASGGTVNVTLGNTTEMNTLLSLTSDIIGHLWILYDNIAVQRSSATVETPSHVFNGRTYSYNTVYTNIRTYSYSNNTINVTNIVRYTNFRGLVYFIYSTPTELLYYLSYSIRDNIKLLLDKLVEQFNTYWSAYYPLKDLSESQFWIAYNTDTGEYDHVNIATVLGYITWYLGQLYNDGTNITQNMEDMTDNINTAATTFQDMEQKEQAAIDQISQGFETFLPDVNTFSSFRAITWCSNYLQQIYLALGSYGTVIFIALLFGVCLQFIGYFRYK